MAGFQPARSRVGFFTDDSDDIEDWMAQRNAEVATRQDAETIGRQAWEDATRSGQSVAAPRPRDLIALGARSTGGGITASRDQSSTQSQATSDDDGGSVERAQPIEPDGPLSSVPRLRFMAARPGDSISSLVGTSDPAAIGRFLSLNNMEPGQATIYAGHRYVVPTSFDNASRDEVAAGRQLLTADDQRVAALRAERARRNAEIDRQVALLNAGRNMWTGELVDVPPPRRSLTPPVTAPRSWLDNSPLAKRVVGDAAAVAGQGYGVLRGGWHGVEGAATIARLVNPLDPLLSAPGEAAWDQVIGSGRRIASGIARRVADPNLLRDDFHRANVALNPEASPIASTVHDEIRRRFRIGANQGELLFNLAAVPLGGEVGSGLEALEYAGEAGDVGKYLKKGFSQGQAEELAQPYDGMGHHIIGRAETMPAILGGGPWPKALTESPLFLLKPRGIDKGQFYELHYGVDRRFHGTRIKGFGKGQGFSGRNLGLPEFQGVERAWRGTTGYAKGVASGAMLGAGEELYGGPQ